MTDCELRVGLQAGLEEAWAVCQARHEDEMLRVARGYLGPGEDARDGVQEAWVRALGAAHLYDPTLDPGPWLRAICVRVCIDFRRKRCPECVGPEDLDLRAGADEEEGGGSDAEQEETCGCLRDALAELPQREGAALRCTYIWEMSTGETAILLRTSTGAVSVARSKGLRRMRTADNWPMRQLRAAARGRFRERADMPPAAPSSPVQASSAPVPFVHARNAGHTPGQAATAASAHL